jgi:hypothetical protein
MKKLQMNIPDELHKRLKRYCVDAETQMTEVVLKLIEDFLEKTEKKLKK